MKWMNELERLKEEISRADVFTSRVVGNIYIENKKSEKAKKVLIDKLKGFKPEAHFQIESGNIEIGKYEISVHYHPRYGPSYEMRLKDEEFPVYSRLFGDVYILGENGYAKKEKNKIKIRPAKVEDIGKILAIVKPGKNYLELYK